MICSTRLATFLALALCCCAPPTCAQQAALRAKTDEAEPPLPTVKEYAEENCPRGVVVVGLPVCEPRVPGGGTMNGLATKLPRPAYPSEAKAAKISGVVALWIVIDETGEVVAAQILSGHPLLRAASLGAVRGARFPPALVDGKPVKRSGIVDYHFDPR